MIDELYRRLDNNPSFRPVNLQARVQKRANFKCCPTFSQVRYYYHYDYYYLAEWVIQSFEVPWTGLPLMQLTMLVAFEFL